MQPPYRLPDGGIVVPVSVRSREGDERAFIGDTIAVLRPGDAGYDRWDTWLRNSSTGEAAAPSSHQEG